ncbi:fibronectin type III domain-containing protein [Candidatus Poribacteria bacterium]|nr:fibronectin type III domain-containing protein [Candidatus Poribacteria bacterium]MYB65256.1 fibronectin type III domain-containing protein [Candidatus Poribacteria bacterium]MYF56838.1 fibronectin type III domain-containing protein [Candidatus Poribacteria bacterium]MYI93433.1 fibronectin type III domain-containing protein [Candidatus Poribacteria bacterium]
MMKQILTCLVVFVMISCSAFAQDVVTEGNREYAGFNTETYDYAYATAYDRDPVSSDDNPDADPIVDSKSRISAKNKDNGVHHRTAQSRVKCYSDEYKGTYGVIANTPEETIVNPDVSGRFEGVYYARARVEGEVLGTFDCRISVHKSTTSGGITAYKKNENVSEGPAAWADSFIPWKHNPNGIPDPPPQRGISPSDPNQTPQPGDSVTLNLATAEPYYSVNWYVKTPWDTSESGTYLEDDYGDGTSTTASLTYVFPSGTMHTGDFIFAADIYRWSDMSWQSKETYTVSVSNPTAPSIPQSVTASPGTSRWSVSLSWSAPSSDGGSAITGYEYQYRRYYAGTWESWSSWQSVSSTSTTVTGLISNGTYEFQVRAVNSVGAGYTANSVTTRAQ